MAGPFAGIGGPSRIGGFLGSFLKGRRVNKKLADIALVASLPAAAALFTLLFTALVVLWAYDSYQPQPGRPGSASGARLASAAGAGRERAEHPSPFLSDLLPESDGGKKKARPLTREEKELSVAEALYKNNIIRRSEMMQGKRPQPPYKAWDASRLREVFLTAPYPCPRTVLWGSQERGKYICNPEKLESKPTVSIYTFGALEDLSFEQTASNKLGSRAKIMVFSPYLSPKGERELMSPQSAASKFITAFEPIGVGAKDSLESLKKGPEANKEFFTFTDILKRTGDTHIDVLKIDCEGCEEALILELASEYPRSQPPFDQVIVELHQTRNPAHTLPVLFALEDMGFRLFSVVPDRRSSTKRMELSFVHELYLYPQASKQNLS